MRIFKTDYQTFKKITLTPFGQIRSEKQLEAQMPKSVFICEPDRVVSVDVYEDKKG